MKQLFAIAGGMLFIASLLFFAMSYAWRFAEAGGPWSMAVARQSITIDILLFSAFAMHHSIFARTGARRWLQRHAPPGLERSIYVWLSSLLFAAVCAWWQPVPGRLWHVSSVAGGVLAAAQIAAGIFTVMAARHLDVLELAGVRQARSASAPTHGLDDRGPYGLVRHPIYLGWFAMVWLTPVMTGTKLVFAAVSCVYLLLAIPFEERELRRGFGAEYDRYAQRVRWKIIPGVY
jgi:protein-S-isoprenylcysteine O-methyltransferase Ste14